MVMVVILWWPWWCVGWFGGTHDDVALGDGGALVGDWSYWCTWWWLFDHGFGAMMLTQWWLLLDGGDGASLFDDGSPLLDDGLEPWCFVLPSDGCCLDDRALDDGWWLSSCFLLRIPLSLCPFIPYLIYPCVILLLPCKHFLKPNTIPLILSYSLR